MTSVVQICNEALSHVGDPGLITSLTDGSAQAAHCSKFYTPARKAFLEQGTWTFAQSRATLSLSGTAVGPWLYRYAYPSNCLRLDKVLLSTSLHDEPSEPFLVETDASTGLRTILSDAPEAEALFAFDQQDVTQFSPGAATALAYLLGSYLAGPIVKGKAGVALADALLKKYTVFRGIASTADAAQAKPNRTMRQPRPIEARR